MSRKRMVLTVVATAIAFVVGFYAGIFALLSTVGLDQFEGWQFPIATVPTGGVFAAVMAAVASGSARRVWASALTGSLVAAAVVTIGLLVFDGDFGVAIGVGGAVVVATTTTATIRSAASNDGTVTQERS